MRSGHDFATEVIQHLPSGEWTSVDGSTYRILATENSDQGVLVSLALVCGPDTTRELAGFPANLYPFTMTLYQDGETP